MTSTPNISPNILSAEESEAYRKYMVFAESLSTSNNPQAATQLAEAANALASKWGTFTREKLESFENFGFEYETGETDPDTGAKVTRHGAMPAPVDGIYTNIQNTRDSAGQARAAQEAQITSAAVNRKQEAFLTSQKIGQDITNKYLPLSQQATIDAQNASADASRTQAALNRQNEDINAWTMRVVGIGPGGKQLQGQDVDTSFGGTMDRTKKLAIGGPAQ